MAPHGKHAASLAWDSGFYRFAECIRQLSCGEITHKQVYALVGSKGRYVNHKNASVRKHTAASLSRLIHSSRYAADMRKRHAEDPEVFNEAAVELAAMLASALKASRGELLETFLGQIWPEVFTGLCNEAHAGREGMQIARVNREYTSLAAWCYHCMDSTNDPLDRLVAAILHIMAYGCLDPAVADGLVAKTPLVSPGERELELRRSLERQRLAEGCAFVAHLAGEPFAISGAWSVDGQTPFTIGRATTCSLIEGFPYVSHVHCTIVRGEDGWLVRDEGSRHGTRVLRPAGNGSYEQVFCSLDDSRAAACPLRWGDVIELAGASRYLFGGLAAAPFEDGRMPNGGRGI